MADKRPLIVVSNDDGITANGIRHLVECVSELGDVLVVAPNSPQSGMGHAITINEPLKIYETDIFKDLGVEAYECSGTPADCIKLAKNYVLGDRIPDLVVSGVNHGSNTSVSVLYSGTMSATIEASIESLPSIGFSLCDFGRDADFSHTAEFVKKIAKQVLAHGLPKGVCLNVNFPKIQEEPIKGIKYCRQAIAKWVEKFDEREDPYGRKYLWLTGEFVNNDRGEDTDEWAIKNNFASIVPVSHDMTAHEQIPFFHSEWNI